MTAPGLLEILAVALGLGLGTLALRLVFGELRGRVAIGSRVHAALEWVPVAALAALVFPAFSPAVPAAPAVPRLAAALVTCVVAWKTRNLLASVTAGVASFWTADVLL